MIYTGQQRERETASVCFFSPQQLRSMLDGVQDTSVTDSPFIFIYFNFLSFFFLSFFFLSFFPFILVLILSVFLYFLPSIFFSYFCKIRKRYSVFSVYFVCKIELNCMLVLLRILVKEGWVELMRHSAQVKKRSRLFDCFLHTRYSLYVLTGFHSKS